MIRQLACSPKRNWQSATSIKNVARETKHMDPAYLQNGNDITDAFKAYAAPIVGALPPVGTLDELKG